jgi:hypothetical protein
MPFSVFVVLGGMELLDSFYVVKAWNIICSSVDVA